MEVIVASKLRLSVIPFNGKVGDGGRVNCEALGALSCFVRMALILDLVRDSVLATDRRIFVRDAETFKRFDGSCPNSCIRLFL